MGTYFTWPWKRKEYAGVGNPRFVSDILSDNELALEGLKNVLGLGSADFAIVSGLEYDAASTSYAPGTIFFNGSFYNVPSSFLIGLYLTPSVTDVMPQPFNDGNSRNIYTIFEAVTTTNPTGSTPVFTGDMNQYRISNKVLKQSINTVNTTLASLGTAAFADIGTTPGTVAPGDASYSKATSDGKYIAKAGDTMTGPLVLSGDPTANLQAATRQYVDNSIAAKCVVIATLISSGGGSVTVQKQTIPNTISGSRSALGDYTITHNLGHTNYFVTAIAKTSSAARIWHVNSILQNANNFRLYTSDDASAPEGDVMFQIWTYTP